MDKGKTKEISEMNEMEMDEDKKKKNLEKKEEGMDEGVKSE